MKKATNKLVVKWQRSAKFRPLLHWRKKSNSKRARSRKIYIGLGKKQAVLFNLRRFHLKRKGNAQLLLLPLRGFGYRQLAISTSKLSVRKYQELGLNFQPKRVGSMLIMTFGVIGIGIYGGQLIKPPVFTPATTYALPVELPKSTVSLPNDLNRSAPIRLNAAKIGVDYPVEPVGLKDDGTMETPGLFDKVTGWFEPGVSPGQVGPAVIVGHINTYLGPSVFARLHELAPGDKVSVTRQDGIKVIYQVQSIQQFDQDNFPTKKVYGRLDYPGLRLITCGGSLNPLTGKYSHNTVVFAKMTDHTKVDE